MSKFQTDTLPPGLWVSWIACAQDDSNSLRWHLVGHGVVVCAEPGRINSSGGYVMRRPGGDGLFTTVKSGCWICGCPGCLGFVGVLDV